MPYTALYRKWRPQTFEEVRGQEHIVKTLKNQMLADRIGHAYLFCGTRGTGKTSIAKIFARAVNCENPKDGSPCGECPMCRKIAAGASLNVSEIDAASNNGVEDVREIRSQVQYPPAEGRFKVFIIDEVHMLSPGAFNALLKTLEEPPEYVIFILATTEVNKIPVTILSRCQRYDFRRISAETIAGHLAELASEEGIDAEEAALRYVARLADGSMRDALSLLDQCAAFYYGERLTYDGALDVLGAVDNRVFHRLFDALTGGDAGALLREISDMVMQGRELGQMVTDFIWYLRNVLLLKTGGLEHPEDMLDVSREEAETMAAAADKVSREALMRYIRVLSELSGTLRFATQKRVLTEIAFIRLTRPEMENDTDSLVQRLENLEKKVEELPAGGVVYQAPPAPETEKPEQAVRQVVLPRAEYDQLMRIRGEWPSLVAAMEKPLQRRYLKNAVIEAGGSGQMCVVVNEPLGYDYIKREGTLEDLEKKTGELYGLMVTYTVRLEKEDAPVDIRYVTEGDLDGIITVPVEEE